MTAWMDLLIQYAQSDLMQGYLCRDREYQDAKDCAQKQEQSLRACLTPEQTQILDNLLGEQQIVHWAMMDAAFQAGFSLAMELNRV